jgi:hypothetical protein
MDQKINIITRPYKKADFTREYELGYQFYTDDEIFENYNCFFKKLPSVYKNLISQNFPLIKEDIDFMKGCDCILVTIHKTEVYEPWHFPFNAKIFYLKTNAENSNNMYNILSIEESLAYSDYYWKNQQIEFNSVIYQIMSLRELSLGFLTNHIPVLKYSYKLIAERLQGYWGLRTMPTRIDIY